MKITAEAYPVSWYRNGEDVGMNYGRLIGESPNFYLIMGDGFPDVNPCVKLSKKELKENTLHLRFL